MNGTGITINYIIECLIKWWRQISYTTWMYFALLLPLTAVIYQLVPRKGRRFVLLAASWIFLFSLSGRLFFVNLAVSVFIWAVGILMSSVGRDNNTGRRERQKKKRRILSVSIVILLANLVCFKYLDFLGLNLVRITQTAGIAFNWHILDMAVPIGISFYTLEAVSYLADIYWDAVPAEKNIFNIFLYMSFFPKLMEGPITRYPEAERLFKGDPLRADDLMKGYQRILWGLFKKLVIADHLAPAVTQLYEGQYMDGGVALFAAVAFTLQEYMDFSGAIDIALGSAEIFGIRLPENFRQPFFAKNASDFWRRWHITLGTFFRTYIFYPVAVSKPVSKAAAAVKHIAGEKAGRFVPSAIALFCVWLSNGLWHGPKWSYIFYGMYYFVIIMLENILAKPFMDLLHLLHLKETSAPVKIFRYVKLLFIVIIGELFYRADSLNRGLYMFKLIFTDLRFDMLIKHLQDIGIDIYGYFVVVAGLIAVSVVETLKEKGISIRKRLNVLPVPVRFAFWYICIFIVVIFGAYGTGYDTFDLLYAQI